MKTSRGFSRRIRVFTAAPYGTFRPCAGKPYENPFWYAGTYILFKATLFFFCEHIP